MQITIEMIESKEFKIRPKGYDQQEVDEFLDAICDEMAAQQDQIQSLQQQLMSAQAKRPAPVAAPAAQPVVTADATNSLKEILEMAQKVKSETIGKAGGGDSCKGTAGGRRAAEGLAGRARQSDPSGI